MYPPKKTMYISPHSTNSHTGDANPTICRHVLENKYDEKNLKLTIYQFYVRFVIDSTINTCHNNYHYLVIDKFDNNTNSNNKKYTIAFKPKLKRVEKLRNKTYYEYEYEYNDEYQCLTDENDGEDFKITVIAGNGQERPFYLELEYSILN